VAAEDSGRISVSRDALRAELTGLELRLVQSLATQTEVDVLRKDVDSLKRWRAYVAGASAVALALGSTAVGIVIAYLSN
jgi:hypothetical protein